MAFATLDNVSFSARGIKRTVLTLAGVLGIGVMATQMGSVPAAHAAPGFTYHRGYSVQHNWLCYGWSNGNLHCTQRWHRSGGAFISGNPGWVPSSNGQKSAAYQVHYTAAPKAAPKAAPVAPKAAPLSYTVSATPGNIGQWVAPAGHPAYGMSDFAGDPYRGYFGDCTWYAWYRHQNEPLMQLGNAAQWAYNASAHGLRTGTAPVAGATVVFQPGVQGASGIGHAGHVEQVYGNGWFLISEMSFYWNGGGFGRVSYRYVHTGAGVSFIY